MKVIIMLACAVLVYCIAGCSFSEENKQEIKNKVHQAIIKLVEDKGQQAAMDYVDKLFEEGKISKNLVEKVKSAIPKGVDKLKEVLKEGEV